jgi:hypothetical protein
MRELAKVDEQQQRILEKTVLEEAAKTDPLAALEVLPRVGWWAKLRKWMGL